MSGESAFWSELSSWAVGAGGGLVVPRVSQSGSPGSAAHSWEGGQEAAVL